MLVFFAVVDTNSVKKLNFSRKKLELSKHAFTVEFCLPPFLGSWCFSSSSHRHFFQVWNWHPPRSVCQHCGARNPKTTRALWGLLRTSERAKVWWHYMLKRRSWTPIVAEMIKCILSAAQMIIVCPWCFWIFICMIWYRYQMYIKTHSISQNHNM